MMVLVAYDVNTTEKGGARRLRRVAKTCQNYGQRVQNSVFECVIDPAQLIKIKAKLIGIMNLEKDSLRLYYLGSNWDGSIEHFGTNIPYDIEGTLQF